MILGGVGVFVLEQVLRLLDSFLSGRRDTLKKTRLIVIVVTAAMLTSLLAGLTFAKNENNPFAQIWSAVFDLQT